MTIADKGKNGARALKDKSKNIAQTGKSKFIDPAKEKLHVVEHKIDQMRHSPNTQVFYLAPLVGLLRV